ncbi:MAG: chromosome segregation protein SMC, partial [Oscillospiraceae bacterium]
MYLKAIELHGFKSFPDKIRVSFDKGMTAVVGPNGSGKSNISDAIRWVMGETSGKELRATGKMEDIIFGGTQQRGPMGFAMVSLILDNTDRSFDMDSDEVSITRKYYRGGEGEYFINSNRVRLKDIYELFLDTGLGRSGYSIVGQGKISQIVTSKPEGRREIFEEASGISKFRYKKNEAEKKLAGAQDNILRLTDILLQLEGRVGPLEIESKKAKEFVELAQRKKGMEISLWMSTVDQSKSLIRQQQRHLEILQSDYDTLDAQISEKEAFIEKRYFESNALITKSDENIACIRKTEQDISEENAQKAVLESRILYNSQRDEELTKELAVFGEQGDEADKQKEIFAQQISDLSVHKKELESEQIKTQTDIQLLTEKAKQADGEKGELLEKANGYRQALQDKKIELHGIDTQNVALLQSEEKAKADLANATEYAQQVQKQVTELSEFVQQSTQNITKNTNVKNGLAMKLSGINAKLQELTALKSQSQNKQQDVNNKIRLLTDMENNLEGFQQSVKTILNVGKSGGLQGIEGTVAQLITVEKGYETAVEIALGYSLQNVVVSDETSAKRAIEYLKNQRGGRATFLPLDTVKPSSFTEKLPDWATTADKVIKAQARYAPIISSLLGRTIIVEEINAASRLAKQLNYRYKIVTLDGQQINAGGSFTGGSLNKSAGLFTRKSEIEKLKQTAQQIKAELDKQIAEMLLVKENADLLTSQIEGCEGENAVFAKDKMSSELELAKQTQLLVQYKNAMELQEGILENCQKVQSGNKVQKQTLDLELGQLQLDLDKANSQLESLGQLDSDTQHKQNGLSERLQQIKLTLVQLTGEILLTQNNLSQLDMQKETQQLRREKLAQDLEQLKNENGKNRSEIAGIEENIVALKGKIAEIEKENKSFIQVRMDIEQERNETNQATKQLQNQKEDISKQLAKATEKVSALETAYDEIIQKLWEEYELTVQTAREFALEVEDEGQMKKELAACKNAIKRLGNVNVGAIEEYKEVFEKYSFLKEQLNDLEQSKQQLTKLITTLSGEMKTMFSESFNIINENFGKIFAELFGGGSAHLRLTN